MTKKLRKPITTRSKLKKCYLTDTSMENFSLYKKHRNHVSCLHKKDRKHLYINLDVKELSDSRKFWENVKPFLTDKSHGNNKIIFVENGKLCSDDQFSCETFNSFLQEAMLGKLVEEN